MRNRQSQRGATLLVTLIMLIMLTLFAISAMNTSTTNLRMVGNMQERAEAFEANQATIELAFSTPKFINEPLNAIPNPCGGTNTTCTDLNGDGTPELLTTLQPPPTCVRARTIMNSELVLVRASGDDVACLQAQQQGTFAVEGAQSQGGSLCGSTVYEFTANTFRNGMALNNSDISYTATQGISVRVPSLQLATLCP